MSSESKIEPNPNLPTTSDLEVPVKTKADLAALLQRIETVPAVALLGCSTFTCRAEKVFESQRRSRFYSLMFFTLSAQETMFSVLGSILKTVFS